MRSPTAHYSLLLPLDKDPAVFLESVNVDPQLRAEVNASLLPFLIAPEFNIGPNLCYRKRS